MKKMVNCPHWKEYDSLNGMVLFCSAGAYNSKLTVDEAKSCGCTKFKREMCLKAMTANSGFGLVPEVATTTGLEKAESGREMSLGMAV